MSSLSNIYKAVGDKFSPLALIDRWDGHRREAQMYGWMTVGQGMLASVAFLIGSAPLLTGILVVTGGLNLYTRYQATKKMKEDIKIFNCFLENKKLPLIPEDTKDLTRLLVSSRLWDIELTKTYVAEHFEKNREPQKDDTDKHQVAGQSVDQQPAQPQAEDVLGGGFIPVLPETGRKFKR